LLIFSAVLIQTIVANSTFEFGRVTYTCTVVPSIFGMVPNNPTYFVVQFALLVYAGSQLLLFRIAYRSQ